MKGLILLAILGLSCASGQANKVEDQTGAVETLNVSWSGPSTGEGKIIFAGLPHPREGLGYLFYMSEEEQGSYQRLNAAPMLESRPLVIGRLAPGKTYFFKLTQVALDRSGKIMTESGRSKAVPRIATNDGK